MTSAASSASRAPADAAAAIDAAIARLATATDALTDLVAQETALVREGRLREAAAVARAKADFATSYVKDLTQLSKAPALAGAAPELRENFRERHARFHDLLRTNMTVLATAHAVAEELIRGVSGELARRAAPQTYAASGRPAAPSPSAMQPLAISRTL
ncbi:MAG TPA: hypothetical protein VFA53_05075 [Xanthobacteraceae bacterium]|nr:hypothetical protein [Xanthobacteraceae bacterium]